MRTATDSSTVRIPTASQTPPVSRRCRKATAPTASITTEMEPSIAQTLIAQPFPLVPPAPRTARTESTTTGTGSSIALIPTVWVCRAEPVAFVPTDPVRNPTAPTESTTTVTGSSTAQILFVQKPPLAGVARKSATTGSTTTATASLTASMEPANSTPGAYRGRI